MALNPNTRHNLILYFSVGLMVLFGFGMILIWGGRHHGQVARDTPKYHRDARAHNMCFCYWMQSAFRVPCENIPPELLKE